MKKEIGISAAVLAIMIAGALRADAHDDNAAGKKDDVVRVEKRKVVVRLAENRFEIARGTLPEDPAPAGFRIVPFFREGKAEGMKLYALKPDSPLVEAGLRNGDVVRTVAGIEVVTPEACKEAYEKARGLDAFEVEVERQGTKLVLEYEVR